MTSHGSTDLSKAAASQAEWQTREHTLKRLLAAKESRIVELELDNGQLIFRHDNLVKNQPGTGRSATPNLSSRDVTGPGERLLASENEVDQLKKQLSETKKELSETKKGLCETKGELSKTKEGLFKMEGELAHTKDMLSETETELADLEKKLAESEGKLLESRKEQFTGDPPAKKRKTSPWRAVLMTDSPPVTKKPRTRRPFGSPHASDFDSD